MCTFDGSDHEMLLPPAFCESAKIEQVSAMVGGMLRDFAVVLNYIDNDGDVVSDPLPLFH